MIAFNDNSIMPFGKYMGKRMVEIPAHYLIWLFNQGCQHEEVRRYILDNMQALIKEIKGR